MVCEMQSYDNNLASASSSTGMVTNAVLDSIGGEESIIELSIKDNFILKDFLVSVEDENFNYNLSDAQITEFGKLLESGKQNNKTMILLMIGCIAFIAIVIVLAVLFGE